MLVSNGNEMIVMNVMVRSRVFTTHLANINST